MSGDHGGLASQLFCDVVAAASASLAVSPLVAVVDRYIASRTCRLLFTVYFGTYATANTIDSLEPYLKGKFGASVSHTTVKLVGVSAVSTSLTVYKDSCLTQMFGSAAKSRPVPPISYILFTLRDVLTIYGCFVCPPILAARLEPLPASFKQQLPLSTPEARSRLSQLILPVMIQFVSTPIHLSALDLYNRPQRGLSISDRLARVGRDLPAAVPTRMLRILPAFGVGGVLNKDIREAMRRKLGCSSTPQAQ